jgi:hypothetical protein
MLCLTDNQLCRSVTAFCANVTGPRGLREFLASSVLIHHLGVAINCNSRNKLRFGYRRIHVLVRQEGAIFSRAGVRWE